MNWLSLPSFLLALQTLPRLVAAQCSDLPASISLAPDTHLNDPFHFFNGTAVTTLDAWACRQQEINALLQRDELGAKPPKPDSLTASLKGSTLTITAKVNATSISWPVTITYPSTGTAPFPAIIVFDGLSIPSQPGVATITFAEGNLAQQNAASSRGVGSFYTLYGKNASAGALMAWAWAVSRIIDALEMTPAARIDTTRLGITGCSRNGKGAMVAGAFDQRIALTIVQESGSGGAACWRLSDAENQGGTVQTASEIVQENVWFSPAFDTFASTSVNTLPFDHHMLAGLIAPRGVYVIENLDLEWLGPESTYGCMKTANKIWQAQGISDRMGFSQVGDHPHCSFPTAQQGPELTAFVQRFLLNQNVSTAVMRTEGNFTFDEARWINWTVPTLQ